MIVTFLVVMNKSIPPRIFFQLLPRFTLTCAKNPVYYYCCAGVAQLVEQLIRNQQVAGSSPATSSKSLWQKRCHRLFSLLYRWKLAVSTANFRVAFYKDVQRFSDCWTFLLPHLPAKFWIAAGERTIFLRKNRINPAVFSMFSISSQPISCWLRGFFVFPGSFQFVFKFSILYLL